MNIYHFVNLVSGKKKWLNTFRRRRCKDVILKKHWFYSNHPAAQLPLNSLLILWGVFPPCLSGIAEVPLMWHLQPALKTLTSLPVRLPTTVSYPQFPRTCPCRQAPATNRFISSQSLDFHEATLERPNSTTALCWKYTPGLLSATSLPVCNNPSKSNPTGN